MNDGILSMSGSYAQDAWQTVLANEQVLFARVVRPPLLAWDGNRYCGARLLSVDETSLQGIAGIVRIVVQGDFVAVVATSDAQAELGARRLSVRWLRPRAPASSATDASGADASGVGTPSAPVTLFQRGDVDAALQQADLLIEHRYAWTQVAAPRPATWALAWCGSRDVTVWMPQRSQPGSGSLHALRTDLAALLGLPVPAVNLLAADADEGAATAATAAAADAAADAALLSQLLTRPVRVQLAAQGADADIADTALHFVSHISGALDANRQLSAYACIGNAAPPVAPALALLLTGVVAPIDDAGNASADPVDMQRGLMPPYAYPNLRVAASGADADGNDRATAASLASASIVDDAASKAHVFAHESYITEVAIQAGIDPVAFRLQHLDDARGAKLIASVARQGEWREQSGGASVESAQEGEGLLRGRGFAYARVIENEAGAVNQSWSAWIADVAYDRQTGDVSVTRVVVGQDAARANSPAAAPVITQQLEGDAIDAARLLLQPAASFDAWGVDRKTGAGAGALALAGVNLPAQSGEHGSALGPQAAQLAGGAAFSLPVAAAVANAIYDATGVRLREPPFSGERIQFALQGNTSIAQRPYRKWMVLAAAAATAAVGLMTLALPWRASIAPVAPPDPALYSAAAITRGRLVAAAGDCVVCHTAPNGVKNTGGLALDTPFGTIYSTNITPDPETGIGNWSYAAFERAMREGIHRDGRHLYPAFPYTAFAKTSDGDLQALYAYLMAQEPVKMTPPATKLAFPFSVRPLMAGWNALFHKPEAYRPDPAQSVEWNRGAYLAEGLGHCGACHTPRNALGAEKGGRAYLTGGVAEGWEAPSLTALSKAPVPWTEAELFRYLRTGFSPLHGVAAGPMGPVVEEMAQLPASDVKAIAHYIASFNAPPVSDAQSATIVDAEAAQLALAAQVERNNALSSRNLDGNGKNLYQGACAVCHQADTGPQLFGVKPSLALNTNLHSATPDNLVRVILNGIDTPAHQELGYMPGFRDSFNDQQIDELVAYLRGRFAAGQPAWRNVPATVAKLRAEVAH